MEIKIGGVLNKVHAKDALLNPNEMFSISDFFLENWLLWLGTEYARFYIILRNAIFESLNGFAELAYLSGDQILKVPTLDSDKTNDTLEKIVEFCRSAHSREADEINQLNSLTWFVSPLPDSLKYPGKSIDFCVQLIPLISPVLLAGLREIFVKADNNDEEAKEVLSRLLQTEYYELLEQLRDAAKGKEILNVTREIFYIASAKFTADIRNVEVMTLADKLDKYIRRSPGKYRGTQYFLKKWMPILNPESGWLIILIRRYCENSGEFSISKSGLAKMLGLPNDVSLESQLDLDELSPFFPDLEITVDHVQGKVLLEDPLLDKDAEKVRRLQEDETKDFISLQDLEDLYL